MPLTERSKRFYLGHREPQQLRDYGGPGGSLLYEGFAIPGISQDVAQWVIVKHSFDGNGADNQSQPITGAIWTQRATYNYDLP